MYLSHENAIKKKKQAKKLQYKQEKKKKAKGQLLNTNRTMQ